MAAERPVVADSRKSLAELIGQADELVEQLVDKEVGVYGVGVLKGELLMIIEEGMPDEFQATLATAVEDGNVSFFETTEPVPNSGEEDPLTERERRVPDLEIVENMGLQSLRAIGSTG